MIESSGVINISKNRASIDISRDFCEYYKWFLNREYKTRFHSPMHGCHITLINPTVNRGAEIDKIRKYNKLKVNFHYSPFLIEGGFTKGFYMFYLNVVCGIAEKIMDEAKVHNKLHITICNSKGGTQPFLPPLIEIR